MNHLSPPPSPHSQQPSPAGLGCHGAALDKQWMQRASAFNTVIASAAAQKLNGRGEFHILRFIWICRKIDGEVRSLKKV